MTDPATDPATGRAAVETELEKVESLIATALRLLGEGRVVDLTALEARTRAVCDAALALPADDRKALIAPMEALLAGLDTLTASLNARFGDLPALTSTVGADAVSSAYGQALKHFP